MSSGTGSAIFLNQKSRHNGRMDIKNAYLEFVSDITMATGLVVSIALLAGASGAVTLQAVAVFGVMCLGIALLQNHCHTDHRLGTADKVTLVRAAVAALYAGLLFHGDTASDLGWWLAVVAGIALALDGIDGWIARRTGTASPFGARFDMETDAFFILVLSCLVWQLGKVGAWVLAIGAMRYVFVAAAIMQPRLNAPLFPSKRRQVICVVQVAALVICLLPSVGPGLASTAAAVALLSLIYSFSYDIIWLARQAS